MRNLALLIIHDKLPAFFPIPIIAIKILKGELGNYATDSQRVVMNKLLKSGYKFKFEKLDNALKDLLKMN